MKSKEDLVEFIDSFKNYSDISWDLYFYSTNFKDKNPYTLIKKRWKKSTYIQSYSKSLLECVLKYQFSDVTEVEEYKGTNPKVSCDFLSNQNELVKENLCNLMDSVRNYSDIKPKKKYKGYIILGHKNSEAGETLALVKMANPIVKLDRAGRKTATFKETKEGSLDVFEEDYCKLYYNTDFLICPDGIYTFNLKFEKFFHLFSTMKIYRDRVIEKVVSKKIFKDSDEAAKNLKSTDPRKFLSIGEERIARLTNVNQRKIICKEFEIGIDEQGNIILEGSKNTKKFLDWLCYKTFEEADTGNKIHANQAKVLD